MEGQVEIFFSFKIQWNMQVYCRYMQHCNIRLLKLPHPECLGLIFNSSLLIVPSGNNNQRSSQLDWLIEN